MTEETATQTEADNKQGEAPAISAPSASKEKSSKGLAPAILKGGIQIFPDKRLPYLDQGDVKAFEAKGLDGGKAFAMLCEKNIVPQMEMVHKYTSVNSPHLPKLISCGVVDWPVDFKEHFVFVYEDKLGKPIAEGRNPNAVGLKPDVVVSTILRNVLDILRGTHDNAFVHGSIRVQNIFDGGSAALENASLGEGLSVPSGYAQPVIYETIPRAMSLPLARGPADYSDDIYALGVTVAALLRTHDVAEGLSDEEIINQKIEVGSFNFIAGKDRFPAQILELLRGTLNDNPALRWNFDDILVWADGRRVSAKQGAALTALKASRPLDFNRHKYLRPQMLSRDLPQNATLAVPLVENGELYLWLNRSLQDKVVEGRYEQALEVAQQSSGGSNFADRLAGNVAIALAPENPIIYRGLKFLPQGFGGALVDCVQSKKDLTPFADVVQGGMVPFWGKFQEQQTGNVMDAINRIENCKRFIAQTAIGYGIEQCVYYLSPMAPCLSEKLSKFYVRNAEDYMVAMEKMSQTKDKPEWFLDRHIVAFLLMREKSIIEPFLADISSTEKHRQRMGVLKIFASIQRRDKLGAMPGLSTWIGGMLDIAVDRFHDREHRKKVREQLAKIKDKGDLVRMAQLFDNYEQIQLDMKNFGFAMRQYQGFKNEYIHLEHELDNNSQFGVEAGRQFATLVSGCIAALVVIVYLIFAISSGGVRVF